MSEKKTITTRTGRKLTLRFASCLRARRFQSLLGKDVLKDGLKPSEVSEILDDKEKTERAVAEMFEEQITYEQMDEEFSSEDWVDRVIDFFLETRKATLVASNGHKPLSISTDEAISSQHHHKDSRLIQQSITLAEESRQ